MNRFCKVLLCLMLGGIIAPAMVNAASSEQLKMVSTLSDKDKKALAKQAGVEMGGAKGEVAEPATPQAPPTTVEAFDVELLTEPSSIETSIHRRLGKYSVSIIDDKQKQSDSDGRFINSDTRLQSAWGSKMRTTKRKVTLSDRKRLQTAWNDELNEAVTKIKTSNELLQYGYNLFAGVPTTFAPATDIPVPPEYVLGPGDELSIQLYGSRDEGLELVVDREGVIELPSVGPLNVAGQNFIQVKALISEKIHQNIIGATVSVSMGRMRSMRVFVLGDVNNPGSYLVSGLSTISNALFVSGGVSKQGSLRHVILKRGGKNVAELDLYDFLLKGDSRDDLRLQPGDVVFVPPVGEVVAIAGEVVRPAIYELKGSASVNSVNDMMELAGGSLATADIHNIQIDRIARSGDSSLLDIDLASKKEMSLNNGDLLLVYPVPGIKEDLVHLNGHVKRPGTFGLKKGMQLSDLIGSKSDLLPSVFLDYLIIQREDPVTGEITLLQPPLGNMLSDSYASENPELHAGDKIFVLSNKAMNPLGSVTVQGAVQMPGEYPFGSGMRISDLFLIAGGPKEEAYLKEAELTRYKVIDGEKRIINHIKLDLSKALAGNAHDNIILSEDDVLMVRSISNWRPYEQVELKGEVMYPGMYAIEEGETIEQLLERAGGLTGHAYVQAAVFTRESIKAEQEKQMKEAAARLQREISQMETANSSINDPKILADKQRGLTSAENVLEALLELKPQGRLLIDMDDKGSLRGGSTLKLADGDTLLIPKRPDQVMVMGEVYNQTAMLYRHDMDRDDLIDLAGGMTAMADEDRSYIIRANGYVESGRGWNRKSEIYPGDTVVVPQKLETFNALDSALDWSKVLMQTAIFTASMVALGVL